MELCFEKSRVEAVMLKTTGNNGYKKQRYSRALNTYTMVNIQSQLTSRAESSLSNILFLFLFFHRPS